MKANFKNKKRTWVQLTDGSIISTNYLFEKAYTKLDLDIKAHKLWRFNANNVTSFVSGLFAALPRQNDAEFVCRFAKWWVREPKRTKLDKQINPDFSRPVQTCLGRQILLICFPFFSVNLCIAFFSTRVIVA